MPTGSYQTLPPIVLGSAVPAYPCLLDRSSSGQHGSRGLPGQYRTEPGAPIGGSVVLTITDKIGKAARPDPDNLADGRATMAAWRPIHQPRGLAAS
jgi:hypothetical protein